MSWLSKLKSNSNFDVNQEYEFKRFIPESQEDQEKLFLSAQQKIEKAVADGANFVGLTLEEGIIVSFYFQATPTMNLKLAFPDTGGRRPVYASALMTISSQDLPMIAFPYYGEEERVTDMIMLDSPEVHPLSEYTQDLYHMHAPFKEEHAQNRKIGTAKERAFLILDTFVALDVYKIPFQTMIHGGYVEEFQKWLQDASGPASSKGDKEVA
ncbi:MAG: hypothetical protein EP319_00070 [Deltaproteobacteria bacterium]|nr:MAG: hypothetical protein EP319_00070 [Deltaproteobacteria bacterium]